ncbi:MAG: universal stress protein [Bacteroidota bacterium]|nr:universal stress protein [Bacteroidota bacterium]
MKKILVPTDFSKTSENALLYAIELAKAEDAKLILLHVDPTETANPDVLYPEAIETIKKEAKKELDDLTSKITQTGKIKYESLIKEGFIFETILNVIKEKEVDLVVMGTKGEGSLSNMIFGSNTAKIIEKARCPVIAVPEGVEFNPIKKITYATAYHHSDINCLKKIIEIAKPFNAQIDVLHISDIEQSPDSEKEMMKKFMNEVNEKVQYTNMSFQLLSGKKIEKALEKYLEKDSTSILALSTHQRDFFDKLFGKSITKHMAYHTKTPLIAFHHTNESAIKLI